MGILEKKPYYGRRLRPRDETESKDNADVCALGSTWLTRQTFPFPVS